MEARSQEEEVGHHGTYFHWLQDTLYSRLVAMWP